MQSGCVVLGVQDELMSAVSSMNQSVDWRSADECIQVVKYTCSSNTCSSNTCGSNST